MKKMKRVLACTMAAAMTASLAACGRSGNGETTAAAPAETKAGQLRQRQKKRSRRLPARR
ncbi:hypothetical protein ADH76_10580 [Enterocloster clostridioformis]|uniref:hypothetical protein n=1 Tax=Enterocloster clostridioformis TaxID=1531 RepID=UPI00080C5DC1|nr:hypothetical protein [Enterocloster clostridioformis]ANU48415.1 hypothetical protein A4V08_24025 [Lachnoclostridium sp. YL32]NDO29329.1 hypothetical protein [Enterocloster clostridioformis]OXE68882.1 hypothetical protein ADH76_10580 [Enterocloster clostridioformis]QQR02696.1 hypothetical protein I5Q83_10765 [Enterocloster clostridioformis]